MSLISNFLWLLTQCFGLGLTSSRQNFALAIIVGAVLASASWSVCGYYTTLWNSGYRLTLANQIFRGAAAFLTFFFTIAYFSVAYMPQVAAIEIGRWKDRLEVDKAFEATTFERVYQVVRSHHPEQMAQVRAPVRNEDGLLQEVTWPNDACKIDAATSFASQSADNFRRTHPFLAEIAPPVSPNEKVYDDSREFWRANPGGRYPIERSINIAASEIWKGLEPKLPATAHRTRVILVVLFVAAQVIPLSLIGYGAYKDLKVSV